MSLLLVLQSTSLRVTALCLASRHLIYVHLSFIFIIVQNATQCKVVVSTLTFTDCDKHTMVSRIGTEYDIVRGAAKFF